MKILLITIWAGLSIYIWAYFSIFCHEMGHFMVAKIIGFKPYSVKIGTGKRMFNFKLFNCLLEFNIIPSGGITYIYNLNLHNIKPKLIFVYLAGPMINCLLLGLIINIYNQKTLHYKLTNYLNIIIFFAIFESLLIIGNLCPSELSLYGQKYSNDVQQVLDALTKTQAQFIHKKLGLARYTNNKKDSLSDFFNNDLKTLQILYEAQVEFEKRNFEGTIKLLEPIVINDRLLVRDKLYILDILVSIVIDREQMEYLQQADIWSAQALALAGNIKTIQGTRGAILIELGRYSEGKQMLLPLTEAGNDLIDISYSCCYIAKADYFLGRENCVKDWLSKAKEIGLTPHILLRIQKEINFFYINYRFFRFFNSKTSTAPEKIPPNQPHRLLTNIHQPDCSTSGFSNKDWIIPTINPTHNIEYSGYFPQIRTEKQVPKVVPKIHHFSDTGSCGRSINNCINPIVKPMVAATVWVAIIMPSGLKIS